MNEKYDLKRFGADKIAFLGMFLISIFIANFLVSIRSDLNFSKPIELPHTGFSISIPTGKDWKSNNKWEYEKNAYVLSTNLVTGPNPFDAKVTCKYFFTSQQEITPKSSIDPQIKDSNNVVLETKLIEKGNLKIHWVHIDKPVTIYWAAADLPNNRTITIEIYETTFNLEIAEKIFMKMIDSLNFDEDNLVKTGAAFVADIKSKGIDSLINSSNIQSCFFIKGPGDRNIGFNIEMLGILNGDELFTVRGASELFFSGSNSQEQKSLFRCDEALNKFIWQTRTNTRHSQTGEIIVMDETEKISVTSQTYGTSETYTNCSSVVPSLLLEPLINPIVQNKIENAVIDVIDANGDISPVLISFKPAEENDTKNSNIVYLEFLDGRGMSESFYLDENNRIIRAEGTHFLERTDIDTIEKEFPGMSNYISEQLKMLDSNSI